MKQNIVFSGIQPTNTVHLGNYFGAIKNWVNLQNNTNYKNIYCVVDLHAITIFKDPKTLYNNILELFAVLMACGIDIKKSLLFVQSTNPYHAELAWILNCVARIGWVNRMTQFKEKASDNKEKSSLGLYSYPVLQAADVLLYNANIVPIGADQKQHIELARDIAIKFNKDYGDTFTIPEAVINANAPKIKSLLDCTKKMSKSDVEDSKINLFDSADIIVKKISKAKTDSGSMPCSLEELNTREEVSNLINIYSLCAELSVDSVVNKYCGKGFAVFKKDLSEVIINKVAPIKTTYNSLAVNKDYLFSLIKLSQQQSIDLCADNIKNIRQKVGFLL